MVLVLYELFYDFEAFLTDLKNVNLSAYFKLIIAILPAYVTYDIQ
jgi:hypothetical protein